MSGALIAITAGSVCAALLLFALAYASLRRAPRRTVLPSSSTTSSPGEVVIDKQAGAGLGVVLARHVLTGRVTVEVVRSHSKARGLLKVGDQIYEINGCYVGSTAKAAELIRAGATLRIRRIPSGQIGLGRCRPAANAYAAGEGGKMAAPDSLGSTGGAAEDGTAVPFAVRLARALDPLSRIELLPSLRPGPQLAAKAATQEELAALVLEIAASRIGRIARGRAFRRAVRKQLELDLATARLARVWRGRAARRQLKLIVAQSKLKRLVKRWRAAKTRRVVMEALRAQRQEHGGSMPLEEERGLGSGMRPPGGGGGRASNEYDDHIEA